MAVEMINTWVGLPDAKKYRYGYYCTFQDERQTGSGLIFPRDFVVAYAPKKLVWSEKPKLLRVVDRALVENRIASHLDGVVRFNINTLLVRDLRGALEEGSLDEIYRIIAVIEKGILTTKDSRSY